LGPCSTIKKYQKASKKIPKVPKLKVLAKWWLLQLLHGAHRAHWLGRAAAGPWGVHQKRNRLLASKLKS
jgi:hypothetical protein